MRLSRYEKETIILLNAAEDTASIYTADPVWKRKLDKLVEKNPQCYQPAVKGKDRHAHSGAERTGKTEIAEDRQMRAFWGRSALHTPYSNSILRSRKPQKVLGYIYLLIMPFALFEVGKED